ncbi:glycosyltransferase family 2 protein [Rhodoflexus caldus]|uniref:glycosyltransferase family 2 protein n=1 Tax=Rhodoflexus caldus TaxID=2891236 RepID=UPI002029DB45|nr:glycosyltransferase family 2 protein [Rhodoflexus caldus]
MPNQYPKISIVTPSFNQGEYIEQTILSVLEQNYPNLEYIIIDGGSTDNSVEIIKKYEKYVSYWVSEPDGGMYHALQKGFARTSGEIMGWINSDDMYHKGAFSIAAEIFSQYPQIDWLSGIPTIFDEKGRTVVVKSGRKYSRFLFLLNSQEWIQQESTLWRRSLWQKSGNTINTAYQLAADFELWMRFFRYSKPTIVEALIGGFRARKTGQLSVMQKDKYLQEVRDIIAYEISLLSEKERNDLEKLKRLLKVIDYPFVNRIFKIASKIHALYNYPDKVQFKATSQSFELA